MAPKFSSPQADVYVVPSAFNKYAIPRVLTRKYLVIGVILIVSIMSFRSHFFPANGHLHCGIRKVPKDNRGGVWTAPIEVFLHHASVILVI
jgi:hypothetical protein